MPQQDHTGWARAASPLDPRQEEGGVVIEYGVLLATIILLLITVGPTIVGGVNAFFARLPDGFP